MNKNELKNWYNEKDIFDNILDSLWESFYEYKREKPAKFLDTFTLDRDNVNLNFIKISHEVDLPAFENEVISIYVDIYTDDKCVGWFKQIFTIDGEKKDKYFVID